LKSAAQRGACAAASLPGSRSLRDRDPPRVGTAETNGSRRWAFHATRSDRKAIGSRRSTRGFNGPSQGRCQKRWLPAVALGFSRLARSTAAYRRSRVATHSRRNRDPSPCASQ